MELLKDVSVRLDSAHRRRRARDAPRLRTYPAADGFRGAPPRDVAALEDVLLRSARWPTTCPQIAELDFNPLVVLEQGAVIVDARMRVAPAEPPRPLGARG